MQAGPSVGSKGKATAQADGEDETEGAVGSKAFLFYLCRNLCSLLSQICHECKKRGLKCVWPSGTRSAKRACQACVEHRRRCHIPGVLYLL